MTRDLKSTRILLVAAAIAVALFVPQQALAQPQDNSTIRATLYGFVPNITGDTAFPTPAGTAFDISGDTLIDNTDFIVMGMFELQKGRWGAFTDVMYLDLGTSKSTTRDIPLPGAPGPLSVTANADVDIKAWVVMAAANIRAVSGPRGTLDFFGGARRLDADATLDYTFTSPIGPGPQGTRGQANANWDGIGGVKGRLTFGRFTIPFYGDAGAGDSDLTVQAMAGVTYAFSHIEIGALYRYLDYDLKDDGRLIDTITFSGPMTGITFKW
jgi:opacity protein-like surface antigen